MIETIRPEKYSGKTFRKLFLIHLSLLHSTNLKGETEEVDKAFSILMVVKITGCEGSDALVVQRVRRSGSLLDDVAL